MERDVSVYDITEHADFVFSAGDVVVRVAKSENESEATEQVAERPTPCVGQVRVSLLIPCHEMFKLPKYIFLQYSIKLSNSSRATSFLYGGNSS